MLSGIGFGTSARPSAGYAVVDVETTGSSSRRHRIVEVAVVQLDREHRVQAEFSTLIDPEGPVGPTHIHGIEAADLVSAPRFGQVAARLLGLLHGRVLVGHNVGSDRAFLAAEYARAGVELPRVPLLCTMQMAERSFPGLPGLSLRACAETAGLGGWSEHTALGDARVAGELFARCAPADGAALARAAALAAVLEWPPPPAGVQAGPVVRAGRCAPAERHGVNEGARPMVSAGCPGGA